MTTIEFIARLIAIFSIHDFQGSAIMTHVDPKFVAALQIEDGEHVWERSPDGVKVIVNDVLFVGVHSIVRSFGRPDPLGERFVLTLEVLQAEGGVRYRLAARPQE
jgi:hypothetical protein